MRRKLLIHATGIALAAAAFALSSRWAVPEASTGGHQALAPEVVPASPKVDWPGEAADPESSLLLRSARGLLEQQLVDSWVPSPEALRSDPQLRRALFLYGLALERDEEWSRLSIETPLDRSSARFLGRLLLRSGEPVITALFARAPREIAASWLAGALVVSPDEAAENLLGLLQGHSREHAENAQAVVGSLLGSREGLGWLLSHPPAIHFAAELLRIPAIDRESPAAWADNGGTVNDLRALLQSREDEARKCDAIRSRIRQMPLARLLTDYRALIDACNGQRLFLEVATAAITEKVATYDFDRSMAIADEVEDAYQSQVARQSLLRGLIDSDQLAASQRIVALPPGPMRDALARALIQETRMSAEEQRVWVELIQDPKLRKGYEK